MKTLLLSICLLAAAVSFSQTKYLIYLKDKNIGKEERLYKNHPDYISALNKLTEKAVSRRIKTSGHDNIITWEDLPVKSEYKDALKAAGVDIIRELTWFNAVSAYLTEDKAEYVSSLPFVAKVEKVRSFTRRYDNIHDNIFNKSTAVELNYGNSFTQLNLSGIPFVHRKGITGEGVLVGVLDTGFDWRDHESLVNTDVIAEYDFIFDDDNTADEPEDNPGQHAHGTAVFSVIGGYKDSILVGASFNSSFLLAKTEDMRSETRVEEDNYAAALIWMENQGVDVTTSSLGYNEFDDFSYTYRDMDGNTTIITRAVNMAFDRGVVTVSAAGNEGSTPWKFITAPADAFNIIAVGSVTNQNNVAQSSGRGPTYDGRIKPDVTAMGVSVFVASHVTPTNYGTSSGTSLAAPIAGGTAALLLSAYPHLTNKQVRSILLETAGNSSSPDNNRGYGLISAAGAVSYPNLEDIGINGTKIRKMFIEETVIPSSVKIHYKTGTGDYIEGGTNIEGDVFTFIMASQPQGTNINFYFTYTDSAGGNRREPLQNSYNYREGDLIVRLNLSNIPEDYILSQNYPNPFNSTTKIDFIASANEKAELIITDAAGQKVKTLFNDIAQEGINTVLWDGKSDRGYLCASGVYFYILKIGGAEFGKKMILLK